MTDSVIDRLNAALEGRYRIVDELGEGGMATVYLADDLRHDRKVAVKVLRPELAAVVGAERFLAEIKTTAGLQHPHILALHDSGEADTFLFYVMPYIEGESLRDRLERDRQLPVEESIEIARKVASALEYAHEQDIVHRDIKPANILMSRGEPLVADFGIALALSEAGGGRITETGLSLGTPHYMSPEQASGERSLDKRSDVYAVGAVLYEMLTGEPPYGGPTAQAVLARILTETPRRISDIRRTVPPHVDAVVSKALEKLPADRFESAAAFRQALGDESFRHTVQTTGSMAAASAPGGGGVGAGRGPMLALAGVALVAILAAVAGWLSRPPVPEQPAMRLAIDTDSLDVAPFFAISPDGSRIAVTVRNEGIYTRTSDEPEMRLVRGTEDGVFPAFSPDGEWLAFRNRDGALQKVSVEGGTPLTLASLENGAWSPHWGNDGTIVFFTNDGIFRVSDAGGEPEQLRDGGLFPRLLPNGAGVVYGHSSTEIGYMPLTGDSGRMVVEQGVTPVFVPETGHLVYGHPDGGLFAVPFDPDRGETTGSPRPVLDEVRVNGSHAQFAVSGNGTLVYWRGQGGGSDDEERIVLTSLDGTVDTVPLAPRDFDHVRFSPDGRRLVFEVDDDIYTYDLDLGTTTPLTFDASDNHQPIWSPDGTRVAYARRSEGEDVLMVKDVDGTADARELVDRPGDEHARHWPTENVLVYESQESGGSIDLQVIDPTADPVEPRPYLEAEWHERSLQVSPDGTLAAYTSNETGTYHVYVRRFPDARGQWRISQRDGWHPHWSAGGDTLYYWASPEVADTLYAAALRTDPSVVVESREVVAVGDIAFSDYDFDPVSRRFLWMVREGDEGSDESESEAEQRLWVVVNWFTELRERLGEGAGR